MLRLSHGISCRPWVPHNSYAIIKSIMTDVKERGFTIIELMLFLAISGALFAALMTGVNGNITQQRYRESVVGYKTVLQNQYSEVLNTQNDRDNNWVCGADGTVSQQQNGGDPRGTTDCVILGRVVTIEDNGTKINSSSVIGVAPAQEAAGGDISTLLSYNPKVAPFDEESDSLDWGSSLQTSNHLASTASILILRSPASGLLRIFTSPNPLPNDISSIISAGSGSTPLTNCVNGDSGLLPHQSVSIDPRIAGLSGVIVNGSDPTCAQ